MEVKQSSDQETSRYVRRKVSLIARNRIQRLLSSFKTEEVANKRMAMIGFTLLALFFATTLSYFTWFDAVPEPDYVVNAEIKQLSIKSESDNPGAKSYLAILQLESGEEVSAEVKWEMYSHFKQGDLVEVGYFSGAKSSKYKVLFWRDPRAP